MKESQKSMYSLLNIAISKGMGFSGIPDSSFTASSFCNSNYWNIKNCRLNSNNAWGSLKDDPPNQWIQVDLLSPKTILSIQTQGQMNSKNQIFCVTKYK